MNKINIDNLKAEDILKPCFPVCENPDNLKFVKNKGNNGKGHGIKIGKKIQLSLTEIENIKTKYKEMYGETKEKTIFVLKTSHPIGIIEIENIKRKNK